MDYCHCSTNPLNLVIEIFSPKMLKSMMGSDGNLISQRIRDRIFPQILSLNHFFGTDREFQDCQVSSNLLICTALASIVTSIRLNTEY